MGFMQSDWEVTVVIDLFMGGGGAGLLALSGILCLIGKDRYRREAACGSWIGFGCIVVGLLCLLADVGQPLRAMLLPVSFSHFTSWMAFGAWFMLFALVASFVLAVSTTDRAAALVMRVWPGFGLARQAFARVVSVLGIAAGFMVTVYTGFLISSATGVPFWSTLLLPAGFCVSAFYLALAVMAALMSAFDLRGERTGAARRVLGVACIVCGVAFGGLVAWHLRLALTGDLASGVALSSAGAAEAARTSANALLRGDLAPLFWGGLVTAGLAVPLALAVACLAMPRTEAWTRRRCVVAVACAACALVGVFAWRYLVLAVGIHQPLSSVDVVQIAAGTVFSFR